MEAWLEAIEQLAWVRVLKSSFFAYPIVNAVHVLAVGALVTSVALMDLRVIGVVRSVPEAPFVRLLRRVALGAFAFAVATGVTMFAVRAREYAVMPLFLVKLGLIGVAGLNFLVFSAIDRRRATGEPAPMVARVAAGASIGLWVTVVLVGRFLGYVE